MRAMPDQPPPLRRFEFRLRTLFVIMTILAVECAMCLPMLREWQRQEQLRRIGEVLSCDLAPPWGIGADQGLSDRRQPDQHAGRVGRRAAAA